MRNWVGCAAAALVAAGCGGGTDAAVTLVSDGPNEVAREDLTCASCTVAAGGETACGTRWELSAVPLSGAGAGPGAGGEGVAATGYLRQHDPDGSTHDWPVDTILRCEKWADGHGGAVVAGTAPTGERFSGDTADFASTGTAAVHVDGLDRCERACGAGQCWCAESSACKPCGAGEPPVATDPPPVEEPPVVTVPPPFPESPPVVVTPPPEPPPFIPL
jgi:hypothetical protein